MTKMETQLKGIVLDAPCQVGGAIFDKGVDVLSVIEKAQQDYQFQARKNVVDKVAPIVHKPREPQWFDSLLDDIGEWSEKTGLKVKLADIYEDFFVTGLRDVEPDDRELFCKRVRERLV